MPALDPFTTKRLHVFIESHRAKTGQLPTLQDLGQAGFAETLVDRAERAGTLEKFYVTLKSGTVVKGYKIPSPQGL